MATWTDYTEAPEILNVSDLISLNENQFYLAELYRQIWHNTKSIDIDSVFAKNPLLPSGYRQLDYIESTGTQHINADIPISITTAIETKFSTKSSASDTNLLGSRYNDGTCDLSVWINTSNNKGIAIHYPINSNSKADTGWIYTQEIIDTPTKLKITPDEILVNDIVVYTFNVSRESISALNGYIFARNQDGNATAHGKFKVYYLKTWINGVLKQYFVPCLKISDNSIGLYDIIDNHFYSNRGTGVFLKGDETIEPEATNYVNVRNVYQLFEQNMLNLYRAIDPTHAQGYSSGQSEPIDADWQRWIDTLNNLKAILEES